MTTTIRKINCTACNTEIDHEIVVEQIIYVGGSLINSVTCSNCHNKFIVLDKMIIDTIILEN